MLSVQVNNEIVSLPTCWQEMSTHTYQQIKGINKEEPTMLDIFSAMVGISYTELASTRSEELALSLYQVCSFVFNTPERFRFEPAPKSILIDGEIIEVPTNFEALTVEQNIYLRSKMDEVKFMEELISIACAVYLQPLVDKKPFNLDAAKALELKIRELPIVYTFPVGFFFLSRIKNYGNFGWASLPLTKLMRVLWQKKLPTWQTLKTLKHSHT